MRSVAADFRGGGDGSGSGHRGQQGHPDGGGFCGDFAVTAVILNGGHDLSAGGFQKLPQNVMAGTGSLTR